MTPIFGVRLTHDPATRDETLDMFTGGLQRDTSFAEGRRFVGLQLRRVVSSSFEALTGKKQTGENP